MREKAQKLLIMLSVLAFLVINPASAQRILRINQSDGTVLEIAIADIQRLTFDLATVLEQRPELAKQLLKLMAFPNPANKIVTLDYSLPTEGEVTIELYNLHGNLMESSAQGIQQAGDHRYRLSTQHLASGAYICRVRQNSAFVTQKIIVKH